MMLLRDYTPVDQDAVFELNTHAADPRWRIDPESPTYADLRDIPQAYQREGAFLVGEAAGAIVAMGGVRNIDEGIFELKRIRVDSAHRRRGYARLLILGLEARTRTLDGIAIILDTTDEQEPAQRLYERLGYALTHTSVLESGLRSFNLLHYRKELV